MTDLAKLEGGKPRTIGADRAAAYAVATVLWVVAIAVMLAAPAFIVAAWRWALWS